VVEIAAFDPSSRLDRADQPAPVSGLTQQRREARPAVEARQAKPIDRAVASDQRCRAAITDQRIILDSLICCMPDACSR